MDDHEPLADDQPSGGAASSSGGPLAAPLFAQSTAIQATLLGDEAPHGAVLCLDQAGATDWQVTHMITLETVV